MIIYIFILIAGLCSGLMDSIHSHDSYKSWGHFWSRDSWADLYDSTHTIGEKIMQASINAWHIAKWTMVLCFVFSIVLAPYCFDKSGFTLAIIKLSSLILTFIAGFKISYK
jgi:hypothetical protein